MRIFIALTFAVSVCTAAQAADGAKFRAIGFSPDSRFFAFEQYGVQDGSGFSYDDVFVLDIEKDDWVKGTPVNTIVEDEASSIAAVRTKAGKATAAILQKANITADPEILASNPYTEVVADRTKLTFHDNYSNGMGLFGTPENEGTWTLSVSTVPVPLPEGCEEDIGALGYRLELKNNKTGVVALLHQDSKLPKSRLCAVGYDLEAIVQPAGGSEQGQLVGIIGVYSRGFEGADRRFIAVPFKFN